MEWLVVSVVFLVVLVGHFIYVTRDLSTLKGAREWASYEFEQPGESRFSRYIGPGEYWLGLSYGIAGAFAAFSLARVIRLRRESLATPAGGIALGGLLWAGVCFFGGCCGSPMLPIYLGLLGPKFLGVAKPFVFVLTLGRIDDMNQEIASASFESGHQALEIGCRTGALAFSVTGRVHVIGIHVREKMIETCRMNEPQADFVHINTTAIDRLEDRR